MTKLTTTKNPTLDQSNAITLNLWTIKPMQGKKSVTSLHPPPLNSPARTMGRRHGKISFPTLVTIRWKVYREASRINSLEEQRSKTARMTWRDSLNMAVQTGLLDKESFKEREGGVPGEVLEVGDREEEEEEEVVGRAQREEERDVGGETLDPLTSGNPLDTDPMAVMRWWSWRVYVIWSGGVSNLYNSLVKIVSMRVTIGKITAWRQPASLETFKASEEINTPVASKRKSWDSKEGSM